MTQNRFAVYFIVSAIGTLMSLTACQPAGHSAPDKAPELGLPQVIPFERSEEKPSKHTNAEIVAILDKADHVSLPVKDQCAKQICGDPRLVEIPSDIVHGKTAETAEAKTFFETELRPLLEKAYETEVDFQLQNVKRIEEVLPRLQNIKLSKSYTALFNAIWFYRQIRSAASAVRSGSDRKIRLDMAALKRALPSLSPADLDAYKSFFADYELSEEAALVERLVKLSLSDVLKLRYPKIPLAQSEHELGQRMFDRIHKLQIAFPEQNLPMPAPIEALANDKALTPSMAKDLPNAFMLAYFSRAVLEKTDLYSSREIPTAQILTEFQQKNRLQKLKTEVTNSTIVAHQREKLFGDCRAVTSRILQSAANAAEVAKAQKLMATVKDSMSNVVLAELKISDDLIPMIQQKIQSVQIQVPTQKDEVMVAMKRDLEGFAMGEGLEAQHIRDYADQVIFGVVDQELDEGLNSISKLEKLCKRFSPPGITDVTLSKIDEINLSWQTVKFPIYGVGLMAHELGHVVSAELTRLTQIQFNSLKVCTSRRHGSFESTRGSRYSEEDFADVLGAHVLHDLKTKNVPIANPACIFLEKTDERWGTRRGLSFSWPENLNDDVHSTDFYRLIQFQLNSSQTLPPACQNAVDNFAPSTKLQCAD